MKRLLHTLFITTFIYCASLNAMELTILPQANTLPPKEIITLIAGYCHGKEKNILMRVCRDFCKYLKDRTSILKANPSTVNLRDKEKDMFTYTYVNNIKMMKFLLKNGIKAQIKNILGMTLFHIASDNRHEKAMQLLINHNANVDTLKPPVHALHEAVYKGEEEAVKTFLRLKINPNLSLVNGATPLYIASHEGHINIVESLLHAQANVNQASNNNKQTALYIASAKDHAAIAKLLINAGADINQTNKNEFTPLCAASFFGNTEIITLLLATT